MARLFRKSRFKVLSDMNFRQYFIYALGEVILIVIGILIALWISNSNEDFQTRQREQFYLAGLKEEFQQSREKLEILIEVNRETYQRASSIAEAIARPDSTLSEKELATLLFQAFSDDFAYNPNSSVLQEILSSGRLEILSSPELRQHLTAWDSRIERIRQQENSLREQRYEVLNLARGGNGSIRSILQQTGLASELMGLSPSPDPGTNLPLLESRSFENNVLIFILTAIYTEELHYQPLLEEIRLIIDLIENEMG